MGVDILFGDSVSRAQESLLFPYRRLRVGGLSTPFAEIVVRSLSSGEYADLRPGTNSRSVSLDEGTAPLLKTPMSIYFDDLIETLEAEAVDRHPN